MCYLIQDEIDSWSSRLINYNFISSPNLLSDTFGFLSANVSNQEIQQTKWASLSYDIDCYVNLNDIMLIYNDIMLIYNSVTL